MEMISLKARLLEVVASTYAEERKMIEQLSAAERAEKGTFNHWSAKDVVAHISGWKHQAALTLEAAARSERRSGIDSVDTYNARIFEEQHIRRWSDVTLNHSALKMQRF